jgi:Na+-transporting methylmalonyl-CoA/oxaloacetate decarboxylase beta subunit
MDIGIIGGADGPTKIIISSGSSIAVIIAGIIGIAVLGIIIMKLVRR